MNTKWAAFLCAITFVMALQLVFGEEAGVFAFILVFSIAVFSSIFLWKKRGLVRKAWKAVLDFFWGL
jgi:hypothetical protein